MYFASVNLTNKESTTTTTTTTTTNLYCHKGIRVVHPKICALLSEFGPFSRFFRLSTSTIESATNLLSLSHVYHAERSLSFATRWL